jgi:hypothetical protein
MSISVVCPECDNQNEQDLLALNSVQCPQCSTDFIARTVYVRAKRREARNPYYYSIRIRELDHSEDFITFTTSDPNIELRSKDIAIFSFVENKLIVVQNLTIHRYWKVGKIVKKLTPVKEFLLWIYIGISLLICILFFLYMTFRDSS